MDGMDSIDLSHNGVRIRVALADDHPIFLDALNRLLRFEPDIEVVGQAVNGRAALQMALDQQPDVLLLDYQMPGMNGVEIIRELTAAGAKARILLLTASEDPQVYVDAVRHGALGIVSKNSSTDDLVKSIRQVHRGEMWLDGHTTAEVLACFRDDHCQPAPSKPSPTRGSIALTPREEDVVRLVAQGLRNREIADRIFVSEQTVKNHLNVIFDKLGVSDRLELALYAVTNGIGAEAASAADAAGPEAPVYSTRLRRRGWSMFGS
jgi:DNA-binding NarL/FixJ family response regulator